MAFQCLQNDILDVRDGLAKKLFTGSSQQLGLHHNLTLGHTCHCQRYTLRGLHTLTDGVQGHDLQRNPVEQRLNESIKKSIKIKIRLRSYHTHSAALLKQGQFYPKYSETCIKQPLK